MLNNPNMIPHPITELTVSQQFALAKMKQQIEDAPPEVLKEMLLMSMKESMILKNNVSNLLKNR